MDALLLSGNEAIARGAWEAGVRLAAGYPGTPSTEIIEALVNYDNVYCEWSPNEKVALEVAVGASLAGGRALATMKHVGVNVAADPLFSAAYMGVNGGLVIVSADDPGMHSSQNEQDNRLIAAAARIPLIEPATPDEARRYTARAFALSEQYDTPVMLRTTTRLAHGRGLVQAGTATEVPLRPYTRNRKKNVLLPGYARLRHRDIEERRLPALQVEAERWAEIVAGDGELAFITAGLPFLYVREAFPDATVLKLGITYPLPEQLIIEFARGRTVVVVEELETFLEQQIRALGVDCVTRTWPRHGELSVHKLRRAAGLVTTPSPVKPPLPVRLPTLCPGCSHRGVFAALSRVNAIVSGDIGCYTLGALPPLEMMDSCLNMGASIGIAHGFSKVTDDKSRPVVSVIGDSTFFHSGITGLLDLAHNGGTTTTIVLDNRTTAMTGHQGHPGTGDRLRGERAPAVPIKEIARAIGIGDVRSFDAYDIDAAFECITSAIAMPGPSVLVARGPCVLRERKRFGAAVVVDPDKCTDCHACVRLGCTAIEVIDGRVRIDETRCIGCGICQRLCATCLAGTDVGAMVALAEQGRMAEAADLVLRFNPLPASTARICPHPCDTPINALGMPRPSAATACAVERAVGDYALAQPPRFAASAARQQAVAIVGSGPAGLSAAWQLKRRGFEVVVLERERLPGGMLRTGIPEFRLPRSVLDAEIDRIQKAGVAFRTGTHIGRDVSLDQLRAAYDAVVIAVGATRSRRLHIENGEHVLSGLEFLRRYNGGDVIETGTAVVVIGGGNTAMDCARAAVRLHANVQVVYRRTADRMPAIREEVEHARAEGVTFLFEHVPVRISDAMLQVEHVLNGTRQSVRADLVISAIGEEPELGFLDGSDVTHNGAVATNFAGVTSARGVFACGDAAFGYGSVGQAIASGRKVAEAVSSYLESRA